MTLLLQLLLVSCHAAFSAAATPRGWFQPSGGRGGNILSGTKLAIALGRSGLFLRPFHHRLGFPAAASSSSQASSASPLKQLPLPRAQASPAFVAKRAPRYTTTALQASLKEDEADTTVVVASVESPWKTVAERPVLALVDTVALMAFAAVGKASHDTTTGALSLVAVAQTALPFVASWFLTSPVTGVYQEPTNNTGESNLLVDTLTQTAKGWALAIPLGCVLRGVLKGYAPPVPFVIVTMIATLIILTVARLGYNVLRDFFLELVN